MKKIAIDCRVLSWKHSGMTRYLDNLLDILLNNTDNNEYYLLAPKNVIPYQKNKNNFHWISLSRNDLKYKFWDTPKFLKKENIDIYWSPTQELPFWKINRCKYISTIHDISYEHYKKWFSFKVRFLAYIKYYKYSTKIADHIFVISNFTKKDIMSVYGTNPNKMTVTYEGVDNKFILIDKKKAQKYIKKYLNIESPYIFYIDTVRSLNLLKAFADLIKNEWKDFDIKLVCLGKFSNSDEDPEKLSQEFKIEDRVIHIKDFISDKDLNNLYSGCEFFVSPSFYEGFGLTPLEALRSGAPILISNVTSLPEIFQNAALYCDPFNSMDLKNKMNLLYRDLEKRNKIVYNSKKLFDVYDWNIVGEKVKKIFNTI